VPFSVLADRLPRSGILDAMAKKPDPIPGDDLEVGDAVLLRGEVTRISKNASGGWEVTVQVDGFSQSRLTLSAEHVEKVDG
jgi:hypothetical protein